MKLFHKKNEFSLSLFLILLMGSAISQSFSEGFENFATLSDWYFQNNSNSPNADWGGGNSAIFPAQSGAANSYLSVNYQSTSSTVGTTISNWLFTPTRTYNNGDVITFYSRTVTAPLYPDQLEVRFSSDGNGLNCGTSATSVGTFSTLLLTINPSLTTTGYPQVWTQYTITVSGLSGPTNGRVAFRYFVTNAGPGGTNSDYIGLDSYTYTSVAPPPMNDQCAGAVNLNQGTSCNLTNGTVAYATESQIGCSGSANNDVWYSFIANSTGATISVNSSTSFDAVYEVFTGNCANLTPITCVDAGLEGENEFNVLNNLNIGQTYYIRVHDWLNDIPNTMTFGICVEQFNQCFLQQPIGSISEIENCGADLNAGCDANPPIYQQISCGDTIFGSSWAFGGNRDLDWYEFLLNAPGNVTLNAQAEFPFTLYLVDNSSCINPIILASANFNACQNGTVSYNFSTTGSYSAIIAPALFDGYDCGTDNDYIFSINLPSIPAQISASSLFICPNSTETLTGLPSSNYTWFLNGSSFADGQSAQILLPGIYSASYTDTNGCTSGSNNISIQTNPLDDSTFTYPSNTICIGSSNLTPSVQTSGLFSSNSTGLVFADLTTGEIDMVNSVEGNYFITFQSNGNCPASSTQSFVITSTFDATFSYPSTNFCQSSSNQNIILGANASAGIFSANSSNVILLASTGEIITNQSSIGIYTIYNTIQASGFCPEVIDSFIVEIQGPIIEFPEPEIFCPSDNANQLIALPAGGDFYGSSIQNNEFIPSLGSCLATYVYIDQNGCVDSASQFISVEDPTTLIFGQYPELCSNGNAISLDQASPIGGFYSGLGVNGSNFFPTQGIIGNNLLTYNYTSQNGCTDSITGILIVNESPTVTFQPLPSICDTSAAISLGGVSPEGGIFSGLGVINQTFFDPSITGVGIHPITYTYTLTNCSSSVVQSITVDQCLGLNELSQSVMIYPNPVSQSFFLIGFDEVKSIQLFSMEGKIIQTIEIQNNEFNISHLPVSNYLLKFYSKGQPHFIKLIKI